MKLFREYCEQLALAFASLMVLLALPIVAVCLAVPYISMVMLDIICSTIRKFAAQRTIYLAALTALWNRGVDDRRD